MAVARCLAAVHGWGSEAVRGPATAAEFVEIRAAVKAYAGRTGPGPHPGRLLPAFVDLLAATGGRPNEVLALRWSDVDLSADPPTATIDATLIDHGRIAGMPLHRQDARKGDAPPHTVVLPRFGVDALLALAAESDGPTVVRDALGAEVAQQQLSHAKLATTEAHYLQRQTRGPDVRAVLDQYAGGECVS
jgi:integrase